LGRRAGDVLIPSPAKPGRVTVGVS
jgi:hypothetical protein